jgi:hypothetical protein
MWLHGRAAVNTRFPVNIVNLIRDDERNEGRAEKEREKSASTNLVRCIKLSGIGSCRSSRFVGAASRHELASAPKTNNGVTSCSSL